MPRNDGLVDAAEAARIYGCKRGSLTYIMRRAGYAPADITEARPGGVKFWWRPTDVLAVRKSRETPTARTRRLRQWQQLPANRLYARQQMLEAYRARVLARIAARQEAA